MTAWPLPRQLVLADMEWFESTHELKIEGADGRGTEGADGGVTQIACFRSVLLVGPKARCLGR